MGRPTLKRRGRPPKNGALDQRLITSPAKLGIIGEMPRAIDTCFGRDGRPIKQ